MQMGTFMKVNGKMIKQMGLEFFRIQTMRDTKAIGRMTFSMDRVKKNGMKVQQNIMESFLKARKMEKGNSNGRMEVTMKEPL